MISEGKMAVPTEYRLSVNGDIIKEKAFARGRCVCCGREIAHGATAGQKPVSSLLVMQSGPR